MTLTILAAFGVVVVLVECESVVMEFFVTIVVNDAMLMLLLSWMF